jgi:hypothetical protein
VPRELTPVDLELLQAIADGTAPFSYAAQKDRSQDWLKKRLLKIRQLLEAETTYHAVAIALRRSLID